MVCSESRPIVLCTSFNCCCSCMHSWYALWMSKVPSIFSQRMKAAGPLCTSTFLIGVSLACYKPDRTCIEYLPGRPELGWDIVLALFVGHLRSQSHCLAHHGAFVHECWRMCRRRRLQQESWSVLHCLHIYQRLLAVTDQRKKTWLGNMTKSVSH